jgi:hypothetical protein
MDHRSAWQDSIGRVTVPLLWAPWSHQTQTCFPIFKISSIFSTPWSRRKKHLHQATKHTIHTKADTHYPAMQTPNLKKHSHHATAHTPYVKGNTHHITAQTPRARNNMHHAAMQTLRVENDKHNIAMQTHHATNDMHPAAIQTPHTKKHQHHTGRKGRQEQVESTLLRVKKDTVIPCPIANKPIGLDLKTGDEEGELSGYPESQPSMVDYYEHQYTTNDPAGANPDWQHADTSERSSFTLNGLPPA